MYLEPCEAGLTVVCDWQAPDTPDSLYFVELCAVHAFAEHGTGRKVTPLRAECPGAENIPKSMALIPLKNQFVFIRVHSEDPTKG
jgi:hypothetical protein